VIPVVIDTNVFVSALFFGGTPGKLIALWKSGKIQPHLTSEILTEILRVLACPKFQLIENEIQYLLYVETLPFCTVVAGKAGSAVIKEDPSDDMFLRCCEVVMAKALIGGDNHLLNLNSHRNTLIFTPSQFLKEFRDELRE
jgi:putative PIN family toxin of toxin-antitoxin system